MKVNIGALRKFINTILQTKYSGAETAMIAEVLMFGELSNRKSHGIIRLLPDTYGVFTDTKRRNPKIVHKSTISTHILGNGNPGMLIGPIAMAESLRLGKSSGIGIVGTSGSISSTGCVAYYCDRIAREGLIAAIFTHCSPMVAPFSSKMPLFGTNPISFGFPTGGRFPLVFDMATSSITFGDIARMKDLGMSIPSGKAIDAAGTPTTDPMRALQGALLPFDNSHKGSGLSMAVEILAAVWTGASAAGIDEDRGWGNLFLSLQPNLLMDIHVFQSRLNLVIERLRNSPTRDGNHLRLPGENTLKAVEKAESSGYVDIDETTLKKIEEQFAIKLHEFEDD